MQTNLPEVHRVRNVNLQLSPSALTRVDDADLGREDRSGQLDTFDGLDT